MRSAAFLAALCLTAQTIATGPQVLTFLSDVDDSDQPYAIYVPPDYTPAKRWPVVISLHDAGSNHRLNLRRVFGLGNRTGESDAQATRIFPSFRSVGYIVASPLARGSMGYQGIAEKDVLDVLADVRRRFSVDDDRIYLTGPASGGGGALWLGLTRPDIWAGVAAVCPIPVAGIEDMAGNALNVPVKLFQGEVDPVVPAIQTRAWQQRFRDAGVNSEYVEFRGVRHNAWDFAYRDASVFDWFSQHRRNSRPPRVHFSTRSYRYNSAYWVRLDKLRPQKLATVDAAFSAKKLVVKTENIEGLTFDLGPLPARPAVIEIDGTAVRFRPAARVSFVHGPKGWSAGGAKFAADEKQPGAEGPISEAISSRQVYVYGTGGPAAPDELIRRREVASRAADWSSPRARLQVTFRVLSDKEATDADLAGANLILFGTRATNSRIEEIAAKLPLHLNPGAADYGLVYVYPVNGRYVVVSSGLPWWTRQDQTQRPGLSFMTPPWRTLQTFGDFMIFRGGLDHVVAEGNFDDHWRLPPAVLDTLRETHALEINER